MKQAYGFLEKFLEGQSWAAGDNMTIADFSILSSITSMMFVVPIDIQEFPNITNWLKKMQTLPYYYVTEEGSAQTQKLITKMLKKSCD